MLHNYYSYHCRYNEWQIASTDIRKTVQTKMLLNWYIPEHEIEVQVYTTEQSTFTFAIYISSVVYC